MLNKLAVIVTKETFYFYGQKSLLFEMRALRGTGTRLAIWACFSLDWERDLKLHWELEVRWPHATFQVLPQLKSH